MRIEENRIDLGIGLGLSILLALLLMSAIQSPVEPGALVAWLACLLLFVVGDEMGHAGARCRWFDHLSLASLTALFAFGIAAGLAVVVGGVLITTLRQHRAAGRGMIVVGLRRIGKCGTAPLLAGLIYSGLGGVFSLDATRLEGLFPALIALAPLLALAFYAEREHLAPADVAERAMLLVIILLLPTLWVHLGLGIFLAGLSVAAFQTLRYQRLQQQTDARHVMDRNDNDALQDRLAIQADDIVRLLYLSRVSGASIQLDEISNRINEALCELLPVDQVALLALDGERVRVMPPRMGGDVYLMLDQVPALRQLADQPAPKPEVWALAATEPLAVALGVKADQMLALTPLRSETEFLGALMLIRTGPFEFGTREWQFAEMAANQVAGQMRNAQLYEHMQHELSTRIDQIMLSEELAQQITNALDFNQIIRGVMEVVRRALHADLGVLALLTEGDQFWIIEQQFNGDMPIRYYPRAGDSGIMGAVRATGEPVRVGRAAGSGYGDLYAVTCESALAVPLVDGENIIGVLVAWGDAPNAFSEQQERLLAQIGGHAVISIRNARYLEDRRYEIDMLTSLRDLSLRLAANDNAVAVGSILLDTTLQLMQAEAGLFYRCDGDGLYLMVTRGMDDAPESWSAIRPQLEALAVRAARERTPQLQHTVIAEGNIPRSAAGSLLAIPFKGSRRTPGVIVLTFSAARTLHERDHNTIALLAAQAAGHLENAILHERIRSARDQMRAILDSARAGMILLDRDVRLIAANASAQMLLGIHLDDHIGEYFPDTLLDHAHDHHGEGYSQEEVQKLGRILRLEPERNTRREFAYQVRSKTIYIEEVGSPVIDDDNTIIGRLLVLRDITEERLLNDHREDLTQMMIHDLRGPLASIIGGMNIVESIANDTGGVDPDVLRIVHSASISANRLLRMVNSLLDIARLRSQKLQLKAGPVDMVGLVETVEQVLHTSLHANDIRLTRQVAPNLPPARIDRDLIERVLINLVDNAIHFTPTHGEIQVSVTLCEDGRRLYVRVADDGPGIPANERDYVFEKFVRAQAVAPVRGGKGSGLGLTFCKLAVEAHGGMIAVEDEGPLSGACIAFTLPIA